MKSRKSFYSSYPKFLVLALFLAIFVSACAVGPVDEQPTLSTQSQALNHRGKRPIAFARAFSKMQNIPHGIAGDRNLVFVTEPLNQRVVVLRRATGKMIASIPAPPGGFLLPFTMRVRTPGRLIILDSGGFTSPTAPSIPRIYEYDYTWKRRARQFNATLKRSVIVNNVPFIFAEDFTFGPNGRLLLSDSVLGSIWQILPDDTIVPGIVPSSFAPQDAIPQLGGCQLPQGVTVDGIPFEVPGGFAPGVGSMTNDKKNLYFANNCLGGLYKVPLSVFTDQRLPHQRAADITTVSAKPAGVLAESLKGLTFNRFKPSDKKLYATDTLQLRIIRIDMKTGAREIIKENNVLFNFPVAAVFLPPRCGRGRHAPSTLYVASDQEHRLAQLNVALEEDIFQTPFLVTKVTIFR